MTENTHESPKKILGIPTTKHNIFILGVVLLLSIAAALAAFFFVRDFVKEWTLTDIPGVAISNTSQNDIPSTQQDSEEISQSVADLPNLELQSSDQIEEKWDGASRVNVLIMGLDYRDWESGTSASRTDTMILLTIDPQTKTAGQISIPRE